MSENNVLVREIDFLSKRMIALVIFAIIGGLGIFSYIQNGITLGTDFSGGARIEFIAPATVEEIREIINIPNVSITTLQQSGAEQTSFLITAPAELADDVGTSLLNPLSEKLGEENVEILSSSFVGSSVGNDFAQQALKILAIVALLILVYVGFRFDFIFGIGAVTALLHDMLVMLAFTIIFKIPVDLTILAAFLTILGYSINDTIVIFDRVRENHLSKKEDLEHPINKSITLSLKRTILTSVTTLFIAVSIYIWAGEALRNFGLLLIIGIISGTYSSIFVASPITYILWKKTVINKK